MQILANHADPDSPPLTEKPAGSGSGDPQRWSTRIGVAMITAGGLLVLGGLWIGVTALMARSELNAVRAQAHTLASQLSASKWTAARSTAASIASHAHRANQLTSGPVWALAAALPSGGEPLQSIRGITEGVDALTSGALPQLVSAGQRLDPRTLRRPDGSIDLTRIAALAPALASASAVIDQTTKAISALPRHTWLSSIDASSADALRQVTTLDQSVKSANLAVRIVPTMLGADGPKRYFLAFQNEAESRGTGGLPGAFAIIEANHGKVAFTHMESDDTLRGIAASVNFGPDYNHLYGPATPTSFYMNGNISPHFPYAAQIWASMWNKHSGQRVDGVIALDPTVLGYLLAVTGPATLPDNTQITGDNAVALTQSTSYAKFGGTSMAANAQRKEYLLEIASAASKKILDARGEPLALLEAAGKSAGERRLLVWSADPAVESVLAATSVSGVIPITSVPYIGLSVVNGGGSKLDYYLDRSLTWTRTGCGPTRATTVKITLTNNAPGTGLPPYVTARPDTHSYPIKVGDNRLDVSYFATAGTQLQSATLAGRPATGLIGSERGHPVYTVDVELPRGTSRTLVLHLSEPAGTGSPIVLRQPLVRPLQVTVHDAVCSQDQ